MKILYTNGAPQIPDPAIEKLESMGHTILYYDKMIDGRIRNLIEIRHFQMYENILDLAEENKVDIIYFGAPIGVPEYLLSELKIRPYMKAKIVAHSLLREVNRSLARSMVLSELVGMKQFGRLVITSFFAKDKILPKNFLKAKFNMKKIILFDNPLLEKGIGYDVSKEEARKCFGISEREFVCLLFGSWKYIKGVDIFVEALKFLPENISVIIQRHSFNFSKDPSLPPDLDEKIKEYHPNTRIIEDYLSQEDYAKLCVASDIIVSSHRKMYEYSSTGIPCTSAFAKRLLIAPDFFPFNEIINRFRVGLTYEPEDPKDLARSIYSAYDYYDELIKKAKFEDSLKIYYNGEDSTFQEKVIAQYSKEFK
jgi:glycosyltransferase involved in cell wall biosynthesis